MNHIRGWETSDELMTVSMCSEGCMHLRIGRMIVKLTVEEFRALTKLTTTVTQDLQHPEFGVAHCSTTGH